MPNKGLTVLGGIGSLLLVAVVIFVGLNATYSSKDFNYERQRQVIHPNVNTFLCQAYTITTKQSADMYVLPNPVKITSAYDIVVSQGYKFPAEISKQRFFYLLEGSHISINACRQRAGAIKGDVELLLYNGVKCTWSTVKWPYDCPKVRKRINFCDQSRTVLNYQVSRTGKYYVTVTSKTSPKTDVVDVNANVKLKRTSYDLSHAKDKCIMSKACKLEIVGGVNILMKFTDENKNSSFTSVCEKRIAAWVGIGAIILVLIVVILGFAACN